MLPNYQFQDLKKIRRKKLPNTRNQIIIPDFALSKEQNNSFQISLKTLTLKAENHGDLNSMETTLGSDMYQQVCQIERLISCHIDLIKVQNSMKKIR